MIRKESKKKAEPVGCGLWKALDRPLHLSHCTCSPTYSLYKHTREAVLHAAILCIRHALRPCAYCCTSAVKAAPSRATSAADRVSNVQGWLAVAVVRCRTCSPALGLCDVVPSWKLQHEQASVMLPCTARLAMLCCGMSSAVRAAVKHAVL